MLKTNKLKILISSVIILLPIIFGIVMWNDLPETVTTHFGADGVADGFGSKAFAVFGIPCILLTLHFVCLLFTLLDKKQKEQNEKALGMIFWIIPAISILVNAIMYRTAFGGEIDLTIFVPLILGIMFIFMGNYLPKVKQNSTLGIKIYWTLNNEENWNKTHRFGGKIWVIGGFILLLSAFLPFEAMLWVMIGVLAAIATLPYAYSYTVYKQHKKSGVSYIAAPRSKAEKTVSRISAVVVTIIIAGCTVMMFTGDISVTCYDNSFTVNATYWNDIEVKYSDIDTIEYSKDFNIGIRTNGFASSRLLLGIFENNEQGSYTLYAYSNADEFIILTAEDKTLVIGMKNTDDMQKIFDSISDKVVK